MTQRYFIPCLNKQRKLFNFSIGALVGGAVLFAFVGLVKGLLWGVGAGAIGFTVGDWLSTQWFIGGLQRALYWNLPYAKDWLDRNIPESSDSLEL